MKQIYSHRSETKSIQFDVNFTCITTHMEETLMV